MDGSGQDDGGAAMLAAFEKQIGWCVSLQAPFTAELLRLLAEDVRQGGPTARLIGDWPGDPTADALPLRLAGAFHALVLSGTDAGLAACYPPSGDAAGLGPALIVAVARHDSMLRRFLASPPQTNEVGRSAVLLGGFLHVAAATGLPLQLLEIGASAGLNLVWDQYRYELGDVGWGNTASPVRLRPDWSGPSPAVDTPIIVAGRAGCDIAPMDLRRPDDTLRLRSYVWPDQPERVARLDAAIGVACAAGVTVACADAGTWVEEHLAPDRPGQAVVLYHSIMWQYMPATTQTRIRTAIETAGRRATAGAPVAWLRFEPPRAEARPELWLTLWPGREERRLATAHPHGRAVNWAELAPVL